MHYIVGLYLDGTGEFQRENFTLADSKEIERHWHVTEENLADVEKNCSVETSEWHIAKLRKLWY